MNEQFEPGDYTAIGELNIRVQMKTDPATNIVGRYFNGEPFKVYEVYPELNGILWGRVSSNTGDGQLRFVGLRVNNHAKARMHNASQPETNDDLAKAISALTSAVTLLTTAVRELAQRK